MNTKQLFKSIDVKVKSAHRRGKIKSYERVVDSVTARWVLHGRTETAEILLDFWDNSVEISKVVG